MCVAWALTRGVYQLEEYWSQIRSDRELAGGDIGAARPDLGRTCR
jgi:hypothetical protein